MNKQELLAELSRQLKDGAITEADIQEVLATDARSEAQPAGNALHHSSLLPASIVTRLLFVIGAIFIALGILYLIAQLWDDLGSLARIAVTLGVGMTFAACGSWIMHLDQERELGSAFHGIGGFIIPGGALVTLDEMGANFDSSWPVTLTIGMVFGFYALLAWYHRRVILSFFAFANGTAFIYLLMDSLLPTVYNNVFDYLTMCLGISYILFAQLFRDSWNERLVPLLLFFGAVGLYGAAFIQVWDTLIFEMLYPFLAFGGMVLSVSVLCSRITLTVSTLAVIAYVIYFTAEYFADSIGWPIALILLGFTVIGIGYFSIRLNRKYLKP